jgi:hypothetical protein
MALLKASGHLPAAVEQADIIIAHSAGCWLIPKSAKPRLIIYVGMPLSQAKPLRTWRRAILNNYRQGVLQNLQGLLISTYYLLRQPRRNSKIWHMAKDAQPVIFSGVMSVFIANHDDPWPHAAKLHQYLAEQDWSFISLPGSHDDIEHHSERYVAIINHYARLLD